MKQQQASYFQLTFLRHISVISF